jgi:uroporphyrin-III C-methyltransferase
MSVYLVGAGPGDPGLITVRGLELLRGCDAVVHDALVSPELVAEAPHDALVVSREGMDQDRVNALLVYLGRAGLEVVRLKGGDPFVFGRGGEEALALAEAGVEFGVVPGVSSIAAVPAAALVPVTHRNVADTVTLASGRGADGGEPDYDALVAVGGTIVLFMALGRLERVAAGLISAGLDPQTPAAVVSRGTLPDQDSVTAPIAEIAAAAAGLASPALLVVGHVVAVGDRLRRAAAEPVRASV